MICKALCKFTDYETGIHMEEGQEQDIYGEAVDRLALAGVLMPLHEKTDESTDKPKRGRRKSI